MLKTILGLTACFVLCGAACKTTPPVAPLPAPVVRNIALAQTHVVPPQGKTWPGSKLAKYNLHLVGAREALVLVEFETTPKTPILEVWQGNTKLREVVLNPPSSLPPTEANGPAYSTGTHWAKLEASLVKPGLALRVHGENTESSAAQNVLVGAPAAFTIWTLPFYVFGLTESAVPFSQTASANQATRDEYFAKHPFADLKIINHPAQKITWPYLIVEPRKNQSAYRIENSAQQKDSYDAMSAILNVLGAMREANGDEPLNNHYYAPLLMADAAGQYAEPGGGLGGGNVGTGDYDYAGIFIHEAGHAFGMPHANDGYQSGTYPYVGGSLKGSGWGFDALKNRFLAPFVPSTSVRFKNCASTSFPLGRQFDDAGRCLKQDPMQSGSGDQASGDKYTMFSDFNASVVQQYMEGTTTVANGKHEHDGGRVFLDATSGTGYSRWDSLDLTVVPASTSTTDKGLYGLDAGLPIARDTPVYTVVMTAGIASIKDTFSETPGTPKLSYQDTVAYNAPTTQLYPPIAYTGNLRRSIDPTDPKQLASIVPNTSENPWYCRNSGCDYTLRATYNDNSQRFVVLQRGFRAWFGTDISADATDPKNDSSQRIWGINLPADKALMKLELLETPEVWKGLPSNPKVIASRSIN